MRVFVSIVKEFRFWFWISLRSSQGHRPERVLAEKSSRLVAASGQVYAWGRGLFGRLGSGVLQDEHLPTLVEVSGDDFRDDDSQSSHSDASYSLSARDDPRSREREREREAERANRSIFKQVAAGSYHSLALAADGTVWSWGFNACIHSQSSLSVNFFSRFSSRILMLLWIVTGSRILTLFWIVIAFYLSFCQFSLFVSESSRCSGL